MGRTLSSRVTALEGNTEGQSKDDANGDQANGDSSWCRGTTGGSAPWSLSEGPGEDLVEEMEVVYGMVCGMNVRVLLCLPNGWHGDHPGGKLNGVVFGPHGGLMGGTL